VSEDIERDYIRALRNDRLLHGAYQSGRAQGFSELDILKKFAVEILRLKDEAFQEKLDEHTKRTNPSFLEFGNDNSGE
jgi:hypothetical protein